MVLPGSIRTRHELSDMVERKLSSADARGHLVEFATRLIIEEAQEAGTSNTLGRDNYQIRSELKGNTEQHETLATELLVRGSSVRVIDNP